MRDEFGSTTYVEADLPEALCRGPVGYATRAQFATRYGDQITDRQILEARYGYLPVGATVHELDWEKQRNAPMTIRPKRPFDF